MKTPWPVLGLVLVVALLGAAALAARAVATWAAAQVSIAAAQAAALAAGEEEKTERQGDAWDTVQALGEGLLSYLGAAAGK